MCRRLVLSGLVLFVVNLCAADVITVNWDGSGDYTTIQDAINSTKINNNDTVIVADGVYTGDGNRDIDFKGKAITVRSENGPANCIIDCQGSDVDPHRGFNFIRNEDANSVLDGFQIINGYGPSEDPDEDGSYYSCGGAIYLQNSSPIITNCFFTGNIANYGGGLYCFKSNSTVSNCTFSTNIAEFDDLPIAGNGGGLYCTDKDLVITDCIINGNICDGWGGGLFFRGESATITNCTFINNKSYYGGGGLSCRSDNSIIKDCIFKGNYTVGDNGGGGLDTTGNPSFILNCAFIENSSLYNGGGLCCGDNSIITNCLFTSNLAYVGGGIKCNYYSSATVSGCTFIGNSAEAGGGMSNSSDSNVTVTNCSFTGNSAFYGGGIEFYYGDSLTVTNCILWENSASEWGDEIFNYDASPNVVISYSDIASCGGSGSGWDTFLGNDGGGNIDTDPLFVDAANGDYHLMWSSPCVNAGDPNYIPAVDEVDIDGEPRVMGGRLDMGADEFVSKIVVTKPAGGEVWAAGSTHTIEWQSAAVVGTVDVAYSINGGEEWMAIEEETDNDGSCVWVLPVTDSNNCIVKVVLTDDSGYTQYEYSGVFSIEPYEAGPVVETQWPTLGENAKRTGLSEDAGPEIGCVKWRFDVPGPIQLPVVVGADGNIHAVCGDGVIYTFDPAGSEVWTYTLDTVERGQVQAGMPTVGGDGTLYVGCGEKLYAVDKEGSLRWICRAGGFIYSSPAAADDVKLFFGSTNGKVYAIEADGSELWEFEIPGPGVVSNSVLTSPAVGADGAVYTGAVYSPKLYALDPATADILWECDFEHLADPQDPESEVIRGGVLSAPVVGGDGTIYVSLIYDTNLYAVDPADGSIIWSVDLIEALDGLYPQELIDWFAGADGWSEPVLGSDGTIYVSFDDPFIRAVNPDGSIKWIRQVGMVGAFSMAAGIDGLLYACSDDGSLYVLDGSYGRVLSVFDGERFLGYPVIGSDGLVYVSDNAGAVWALSSEACGIGEADLARPADFDNNGVVNLADFALLAGQWMQCSAHFLLYEDICLTETMYLETDADRDQYINIEDIAVLSSWWLQED